jgi:molybdate transport system ATP-binding protein
MSLRVQVEHSFPGFSLGVSFEVPSGGITVLYGPSGAGKSSVLMAVAGLLRADHVLVDLDGDQLHRKAPESRGLGVVFQDGRLFPHMNVEKNLEYGLKRAPNGRMEPTAIIHMLNIQHLLRRMPAKLSGGERQRVAIGRALLCQPRMLLMDEPLSSLDDSRRAEILPYLQKLRDARIPMLYVTHAMPEVLRLADTLVMLQAGHVVASGPLPDLAARVDLPLAMRDDAGGVLIGIVASHDEQKRLTTVSCGGQVVLVPRIDAERGAPIRLRIPARDVIISLEEPRHISVNNIIPATVCGMAEDGPGHAALVELDVGGGQILSRITLDAAQRLRLKPGLRVLALVKSVSVEVMPG